MKNIFLLFYGVVALGQTALADDLVHDAEYYVLEAQHADQWAEDDKAVDAKLAAFRESNGVKPPNIVYILVDDIGFGDLGRVQRLRWL